jgi:hypothetical protein
MEFYENSTFYFIRFFFISRFSTKKAVFQVEMRKTCIFVFFRFSKSIFWSAIKTHKILRKRHIFFVHHNFIIKKIKCCLSMKTALFFLYLNFIINDSCSKLLFYKKTTFSIILGDKFCENHTQKKLLE